MINNPVVLVDMDGVLADFDRGVTDRVRTRHPEIPITPKRTNFYISADYPEHTQLIRDISDEEGFFESLPLIEGSIDGWRRIMAYGYTPRICSSPLSSNPYCEDEKLAWLDDNFAPIFGNWVVDQAIITKRKELEEGIALIDDRPEIKNSNNAPWQHIVFNQQYNRHMQGPRLNGWSDPNLKTVLEIAKSRQ